MRLEGLRDWPVLLWEAPPEDLRRWFGRDRRRLIANVIWQVLRLLATTEQTALRLLAERPAGELLADPAWLGRFDATDPAFMGYLLVLAAS